MPLPAYMICCQSGIEDKETNLVSLYFVVDLLRLSPLPQPKTPGEVVYVDALPLRIVASWLKCEGDTDDQEFDTETRLVSPNGDSVPLTGTRFKFGPVLFYRFTVKAPRQLPINSPGIWWLENRVCKVGAEEWVSQKYPIYAELAPASK